MIHWEDIIKERGYKSIKAMLETLYIQEGKSLVEIGVLLAISPPSVGNQLRKLKITLKSRGGANNVKVKK